jgi:hypothetical protein
VKEKENLMKQILLFLMSISLIPAVFADINIPDNNSHFLQIAQESKLPATQKLPTNDVNDSSLVVIDDMAKLGVLVIDKSKNLVDIGWEDRRKLWDVGKERIVKEIIAIGSKYDVNLSGYKGEVLVGTKEGGGDLQGSEGVVIVYQVLPNEWCEIVSFPDQPKLPIVKFKSGKVIMSLKQMTVKYSPNTECLMNGRVFSYMDQKWVPKEISSMKPVSDTNDQTSLTGDSQQFIEDYLTLTLWIINRGQISSTGFHESGVKLLERHKLMDAKITGKGVHLPKGCQVVLTGGSVGWAMQFGEKWYDPLPLFIDQHQRGDFPAIEVHKGNIEPTDQTSPFKIKVSEGLEVKVDGHVFVMKGGKWIPL